MINLMECPSINLTFDGEMNSLEDVDIASVKLTCDDREFYWDVYQTARTVRDEQIEGVTTVFDCRLEIDKEILNCKYNLTIEDLLSPDLKATVFIGGSFENRMIKGSLEVNVIRMRGETTLKIALSVEDDDYA